MKVNSVCLGVACGILAGGISFPAILLWSGCANAQVTSDNTTNTTVNQSGNNFNILNGIEKGNNLFHSFSNFSVPTGGAANFNLVNTPNITTIFSRVTGGNVSNIDGLIQTRNGNNPVSLFLMNPNGIVFGPNARLNIGGSFVGTTANSIKFADGTEFSAANPTEQPLLTMSVPVGLQMGQNPGTITNRSVRSNGVNLPLGLRVRDGHSISLIGGNVEINGGKINALGGKIELFALGSGGLADFSLGEKTMTTTVKENSPLANIILNNVGDDFAEVIVMSDSGGDITIAGQNVSILNNSNVRAGIAPNKGTPESVAGNIDVFASGSLQIKGTSNIFNRIENSARGQGGNINIRAGLVSITEGGRVAVDLRTRAEGSAGNINVRADAIEISGISGARRSGISSNTQRNSIGNGGLINLQADQISVTEGAGIEVYTNSSGNAGSVDIKSKKLFVSGTSENTGFSTTIAASVLTNGKGAGGNIKIETDFLHLSEGGSLATATNGKGDAGNIEIDARSSLIEGVGIRSLGTPPSEISTGVNGDAVGNGGTLTFNTDNLTLLNGGRVNAFTNGKGNAGNIEITASNIFVDGVHPLNVSSRITNDIGARGDGNGGIVKIVANSMHLSNGGQITSISETNLPNTGNAGTVNLNIRDRIILDQGTISTKTINDGIAGEIDINTGELSLKNQSSIQSDTRGQGNAGIITVKAGEVAIDGNSQVSTASIGTGSAGNISFVETNNFSLTGGSQVTSSSSQTGDAGSITLDIANQLLADNGVFSTSNHDGIGGSIDITAGELSLSNQSSIDSSTTGRGNAGQVTINAANSLNVDRSQISSQSTGSGNGGTLNITASQLAFTNDTSLSTTSFASGNAGNLNMQAEIVKLANNSQISSRNLGSGIGGSIQILANSLKLNNNAQINVQTASGNGGNIDLNILDLFSMRDRSIVSSEAGKIGNGGNITINAPIILGSKNSDIIANAFQGRGGNINITTQGIFGLKYRNTLTPRVDPTNDITASSEFNVSGTVDINNFGVDPSSGLVELSAKLVDSSEQVAAGCKDTNGSSFVATGRGGIPQNPNRELRSDRTWSDVRNISSYRQNKPVTAQIPKSPETLVQATGWYRNASGKIELVADKSPTSVQQALTCAATAR